MARSAIQSHTRDAPACVPCHPVLKQRVLYNGAGLKLILPYPSRANIWLLVRIPTSAVMSTVPTMNTEQLLKIAEERTKSLLDLGRSLQAELDVSRAQNEKIYQDWRESVAKRIETMNANMKLMEETKECWAQREAVLAKNAVLLQEIVGIRDHASEMAQRHADKAIHIEALGESLRQKTLTLDEHLDAVLVLAKTLNDKDEALDRSIQRIEDRQEEHAKALAKCTCQKAEV